MRRTLPIAAVLMVFLTAQPARADWLLTPFLGVTFGGDAPKQAVNYGASVAFMGARIIGAEFQADLTPNFFNTDSNRIEDSNVTTVMVNFIVGAPIGSKGVRPYASGGLGIIRSRATSAGNVFDLNENSFGGNAGAGIIAFLKDNFGLRFDLRFFRTIQDSDAGDNIDIDLGSFQFSRATLGATFRF